MFHDQQPLANNERLGVHPDEEVFRGSGLHYLGGHPQFPEPVENCTIVVTSKHLAVERGAEIFVRIANDRVQSFEVETYEQMQSRVTATRVLAFGVLALAIPKRTPGSVLVSVDLENGPLIFERTRSTLADTRREFASLISRINSARPPAARTQADVPSPVAPILIADELRKLADLRNEGILNDAEFELQKQRLLAYFTPTEPALSPSELPVEVEFDPGFEDVGEQVTVVVADGIGIKLRDELLRRLEGRAAVWLE